MKILAIGGMVGHFREIKVQLEHCGLQVETANSGSKGFQILETNPSIDLVVLDAASTADACGQRFLRAVKTSARLCRIPILVAGRSFTADQLMHYLQQGAGDVVLLPSDEATLIAKIERAAKRGKLTVLVVDDEPAVVEVLTSFLELERFNPRSANSAEEALALLEQEHAHAVVADIGLPGMSGLELLATIKERWPEIPVIIITGRGSRLQPVDAIASRADACFAKPFNNTELIETLRQVLLHTHPLPQANAFPPPRVRHASLPEDRRPVPCPTGAGA